MTDADARIADTLKALREGGKPPCPWCGARLTSIHITGQWVTWACYSEIDTQSSEYRRENDCYDRQLAALAAECARLRGLLRELVQAMDEGDIYNDKLIEAARDAAKEGER